MAYQSNWSIPSQSNIVAQDYDAIMRVLRHHHNELTPDERSRLNCVAGMYAADEPVSNDFLGSALSVVRRVLYSRPVAIERRWPPQWMQ